LRQELTEEYEQVKSIMGTLESFKSEKPVDILVPQPEERPEDPLVWPPPIPAEHSSALKQQRKESPGLQHRGRAQANPKAERQGNRDARAAKAKDDKV
ncbi:hypothetical protein GOODEAATRI_026388, partial [Goodea atripinnis]